MEQESKTTILFLSADPRDAARLRLDQEQREIHEKLQLAKLRDKFSLEIRSSVRPGDMVQALHDTRPRIVHFSGHGTEAGEICLENEFGEIHPVTPEALTSLFKLVRSYVSCVILNACYSESQAQAIAKHIDFVIGMSQAIGDKAAITFSDGFYRALGAGYPVEDAFHFGVVELRLMNISEDLTPIIIKKRKSSRRASGLTPKRLSRIRPQSQYSAARLTMILDKDLDAFTSSEQEILVFALARLITIPPEQIYILKVSKGSVIVILEMPLDGAKKIAKLAEENNPLLESLRITDVIFQDLSEQIFAEATELPTPSILNAERAFSTSSFPPGSRVDFVVVTALPEERDAVLEKLPGYRQLPPVDDDIRTYFQADLPIIFPDKSTGKYRVIAMCLLGMGRVQAVTATADAIRRWRPRYILMVGIAGGLATKNVRIGDILISDQIVDYELQKLTSWGPDVRWDVQRADPRLLDACNNYRSEQWQELIQVKRPNKANPKRHTGPIASGDKVIAFGEVLAGYQNVWPKLIGVEMEAAGVATAAFQSSVRPGFFMVRGVSDLADNNKDSRNVEKWRSYACDIAASFTIALLKSGPVPLSEAVEESIAIQEEHTPRILVVDDQPEIQRNIEKALQREGYIVRTVSDGEQAQAAINQDSFDLILLDIIMPDFMGKLNNRAGLYVLEEIRNNGFKRAIIMLSANESISLAVEAMKHGASDYIVKGEIDPKSFLKKIREYLYTPHSK